MFVQKYSLPAGTTTPLPLAQLQQTNVTHFYLGNDIGSLEVVTDQSGAVTERQSYDAWGARRDPVTYSKSDADGRLISSSHKTGFTGHEMLDDVGIIHMNGRIYDAEIGRFLSPDPVIQDPGNSQNYAAYTYVYNNPLKFTDPTGLWSIGKFFKKIGNWFKKLFKKIGNAFKKLARWVKKNIRIIVTVVVAVVLVATAFWVMGGWPAISASLVKSMVMGAAVGAASSAVQTAIAGGGRDDILRAGLIGAVTGAISAAAAWGLGQMFDQAISSAFTKGDWAKGVGLTAVRGAGDAAVGG